MNTNPTLSVPLLFFFSHHVFLCVSLSLPACCISLLFNEFPGFLSFFMIGLLGWSFKLVVRCRAEAALFLTLSPLLFILFFMEQQSTDNPFLLCNPIYPGAGTFFKLNRRCLVWIQVKMGKDVGQNLQSKSHSKNRRNWVTQLQKEGPFLKLSFDVCLCERRFFQLLLGHYSVRRTFLLPGEGNTPCLIHSALCLSLANSCPLRIHQKFPQLFFFWAISDVLQLSAACGVFLRETVPLGILLY